jgi:peptidoglycan hydrolase CwlO-like protein
MSSLDHADLSKIAELVEANGTTKALSGGKALAMAIGIVITFVSTTVATVNYFEAKVDKAVEVHEKKPSHNGMAAEVKEVKGHVSDIDTSVEVMKSNVERIDTNQQKVVDKVDDLRQDLASFPSVRRDRARRDQ